MSLTINIRNHGDDLDSGIGFANFDITDGSAAYWHAVRDLALGLTDAQVQANLEARAPVLWTGAQAQGLRLLEAERQDLMALGFLKPQLGALRILSAEDAAYAAMGRAMAYKDGASAEILNAIVDRASAQAYLTSKSTWVNLTAANQAWTADLLNMLAVLFEVLLVAIPE